jgi:hypothetical protein
MYIGPMWTKTMAAALLAGGLAAASMAVGTGAANAGNLHWCPGDPPPETLLPGPGGSWHVGTGNPDWDTTVCHDYSPADNGVREGVGCPLPQFQWFQCPPGTTPYPLQKVIPNK